MSFLNYPYDKDIAKKLSKYEYISDMWNPNDTNTFVKRPRITADPGSSPAYPSPSTVNITGGAQSSRGGRYALPGTGPRYPKLDMVSQRLVDTGDYSKGEAILKKKLVKKPGMSGSGVEARLAGDIVNKLSNSGMVGGSLKPNFDKIKKVATPLLKKAISKGLDIGVPALTKEVAVAIGGPDAGEIGKMVGKVARDLIKGVSGYGRKPQEHKIAVDIANKLNSGMSGGSFDLDFEHVKKIATPILKKAISKGLDIGVPALSSSVAGLVVGPEASPIGYMVGQVARDLLKEKTGYGRKQKSSCVGVYKGGAKPKPKSSRGNRNDIVKKVMKDRNCSLCEASKIVKQENLY